MDADGFTGKTILLVEDFEDSRLMMKRLLELCGYRVVEAVDGRQAVSMAQKALPDLIIMDLSLPEMDGLAAARRIRRLDGLGRVPVIALTAFDSEDYYEAALAAGCAAFLTKPVEVDQIESLIRQLLAERDGQPRPVVRSTAS